MITLNKEDYPVIVKAKPDGSFKVHCISFIVIFLCRLGTRFCSCFSMVGCGHPGVSLALLYGGQALHFEWLAKQAARECAGKPWGTDTRVSFHVQLPRDLLWLPPKEELARRLWLYKPWMWFVQNVTMACVADGRLSYKDFEQRFRIAITGYTYGAALLCCMFLCHWCHAKLIFLHNISLVTMQAYTEAKLANVVSCWNRPFSKIP